VRVRRLAAPGGLPLPDFGCDGRYRRKTCVQHTKLQESRGNRPGTPADVLTYYTGQRASVPARSTAALPLSSGTPAESAVLLAAAVRVR